MLGFSKVLFFLCHPVLCCHGCRVLMSHPVWPVWGCHGYWLLSSPYRDIFSAYTYLSDCWECIIFSPLAQQPLAGQGLLIFEAPHSLRLLWTSYQPDTHTSTWQHTTHNTHKRQTFMPLVGFESAIPASKPLHIYAVECAANGTGDCILQVCYSLCKYVIHRKWLKCFIAHNK